MLAWAAALYLLAESVMSMVVEPLLQSSSTGLSALAILLSAAFWTLLWGPIGLVLAVPLTAVLVVFGRHVEGLRFLDVLLGDAPPLSPAEKFYQRMLAGDPHEAAEQAEEILERIPLVDYYDSVVIEGLRLAQTDADLQKLEASRLPEIRDAAMELIGELTDMPLEQKEEAVAAAPLPATWRESDKVICIAGQSALDEVAASIFVDLLGKHGFNPRLMKVTDVSSASLQGLKFDAAKLVCVSMLDAENRGAYLKFILRRVSRILPGVPILGCFWKMDSEDAKYRQMLSQLPIAATANSLAAALDHCLAKAQSEAQAAAPAPETVAGS
jgi:hypothetical protein